MGHVRVGASRAALIERDQPDPSTVLLSTLR